MTFGMCLSKEYIKFIFKKYHSALFRYVWEDFYNRRSVTTGFKLHGYKYAGGEFEKPFVYAKEPMAMAIPTSYAVSKTSWFKVMHR